MNWPVGRLGVFGAGRLITFAAIVAFPALAAAPVAAWGQTPPGQTKGGDALAHAIRAIEGANNTFIKKVCPGPVVHALPTGGPGFTGELRCQSLALAAARCTVLAINAGTYRQDVLTGRTSYAALRSYLYNAQSNQAPALAAAELARQAPAGYSPAKLVHTVFSGCMSTLDGARR